VLDAPALRAVLAERRATYRPSVSLVWSGPDAGPSFARYTRVVVPELIEQSTTHITLAGYSFDKGTASCVITTRCFIVLPSETRRF
jgi:hypothetical protein